MTEYNTRNNDRDFGEYPRTLAPVTKDLATRADTAVTKGIVLPSSDRQLIPFRHAEVTRPNARKRTAESPIHHWLSNSPAPHHHTDIAASPQQALQMLERTTLGAAGEHAGKMSIIVDTDSTDITRLQKAADRRKLTHAVWPIHISDITEGTGPEEFVDTVSNVVSTYTDAQDVYTDIIRDITNKLHEIDGKTPRPEQLRDSLRVLLRRKDASPEKDPHFSLTEDQREVIDEGLYSKSERDGDDRSYKTILAALNNTILRPNQPSNEYTPSQEDPQLVVVRLPDNGIGNQYTKDALTNIAEAKVRHILGSDKFKDGVNIFGLLNAQHHTPAELQRFVNLARQNGVRQTIFAYHPGMMTSEHFGFFGSNGHAGVMQSAGGNMDNLSQVLGTQYGERVVGRGSERSTSVSASASKSHSVTEGSDTNESGTKSKWFGNKDNPDRNNSKSNSRSETTGTDHSVSWSVTNGESKSYEIGSQQRVRTDQLPEIGSDEIVLITRNERGPSEQVTLQLPLADAGIQTSFYHQLIEAFPDIPYVPVKIAEERKPTAPRGPARWNEKRKLDAEKAAREAAAQQSIQELTAEVKLSGLHWEDFVTPNGDLVLDMQRLLPRQQELLRDIGLRAAKAREQNGHDPIEQFLGIVGYRDGIPNEINDFVRKRDAAHEAVYSPVLEEKEIFRLEGRDTRKEIMQQTDEAIVDAEILEPDASSR